MLEGTACTIYGQRPSGCRKYRCEVLKAAEAGTMGVAEAWVHVGKARELLAGLRAHLPAGASVYDAHKRWNAKLGGGTTVEPSETAARLAYVAYCFYMDRYFRSRTTALLLRMSR
jgi:hypothetical protein